MKIIVTGSAGFIGAAVTKALLDKGIHVTGIDNHNDYYDVFLKEARLERFIDYDNYSHNKASIENSSLIKEIFNKSKPEIVINLAAQAGVGYSLKNPHSYVSSNISGFLNILELSKELNVKHLVYASSSSVYGANKNIPFSTSDNVNHPISLYAASKRSNELMAHTYSHLFNLPTTGLRFFTVYGPWGRPDMALFKFTKAIVDNKPIDVNNNGNHLRDFTYIDDIVEGVLRISLGDAPIKNSSQFSPNSSPAPWSLYNIGNNNPTNLIDFIKIIESSLGKKANINLKPLQPGDVPNTYANVDDLINDYGYKPKTKIDDGVKKFIDWYVDFYDVK